MSRIENDRFVDLRNFKHGKRIPTVNYCDQPYVAVLANGEWLCTLTTGSGDEGHPGEFAAVTKSSDRGVTWSPLKPLEDPSGPESSYSTPLVTPSGRVFVFYNFNGDNYRAPRRCDELGWFVFRYSDDHGETWSERHRIPLRMTQVDRDNDFGGAVQLFWCISEPVISDGVFYLIFSKMKTYVQCDNEGWVIRSLNLLTESDPSRIKWELLPEGDVGIRNPDFGRIQEEHNMVALADGSLYCVFRTEHGFIGYSISRDGARTWSLPAKVRDRHGRPLKNPRVCPKLWRTRDGRYLLWYHHNGIEGFAMKIRGYRGRNPAWLALGEEADGGIAWHQPELLFYDEDERLGLSYPSCVENDDGFTFFCTQKTVARALRADPGLMGKLLGPRDTSVITRENLIHELSEPAGEYAFVWSPNLYQGEGITLDLDLTTGSLAPGQMLIDNRLGTDTGFRLSTAPEDCLRLEIAHLNYAFHWDSDPGLLRPNQRHRVAFVVDGGPKIVSVVVDGLLCDGGNRRLFGWGNFVKYIEEINTTGRLHVGSNFDGHIHTLRIYDRALLNLELRNNHLA